MLYQGWDWAISAEIEAISPGTQIDSLVWRNPPVARFVDSVLARADSLCYNGFHYTGSAAIGKRRFLGRYSGEGSFRGDSNWTWSPDSTRAISIGRYFGEPDHSLEIFNRDGDSTFIEFEFCGTPCDYRGVRWMDNNRFVFVQTYEHFEDRGDRPNLTSFSAIVSLYDLASDSVHSFASDPILRRPSLYVDSMISLIWDNPVAVHFIHTTFEEAAIPGYRDRSLSYVEVIDSTSIVFERCVRVDPNSANPQLQTGLWMRSPDSTRWATILSLTGDSTQLRIHASRGDSTVMRVYSSDATRRHLALRWLSDDLLLVLRVDEDGHFSQRLGHRVVDGNVATAVLYNFEQGYQLSFGSYILMPD